MDFRDRTVVVTGGAGLIGSFVVRRLVAQGAKVVVVDDFSKGTRANLEPVRGRIELREGDLEDPAFAIRALAGCDVVFHLASRAYGILYSDESQGHRRMLAHNERLNNSFLDAIALYRPRHVLVTSSSCVYDDNGPRTVAERPVFEGEPEMANWGYGWAKRFLEQKAVIYSRETGVPVTIVRPFNIYGETYAWADEHSQAIPMIVKRILDGEDPVTVWGSGEQRRSYVHADDCAEIMLRLVARGVADGPVNIGTEETVSMGDLARLIIGLSGRKATLQFDPSKPEGRFVKSADTARLRSLMPKGWDFAVDLKSGLARMLDWYAQTFGPLARSA